MKRLLFGGAIALLLGASSMVLAQESADDMMADTSFAADTIAVDTLLMPDTLAAAGVEPGEAAPQAGFMARMRKSGVVDLFLRGKWAMWPLLFFSIVAVAVIIERFINLSRAGTDARRLMKNVTDALRTEGPDAAADVCARTRGTIPQILLAGLRHVKKGPDAVEKAIENAGTIEMGFLERGLIVLSTTANVAPMLGFLGTVSGMIRAFEAIAKAESVNAKLVASGISEALITTATGLIIAIPVQAAHNYFVSRIDRFVVEMSESSAELIEAIMSGEVGTGREV
jgi:biopolymer transport protein ExbB